MNWSNEVRSAHRDAGVSETVTLRERDGTAHDYADCRVSTELDHGYSSAGALKTVQVLTVVIPRIAGFVKPAKSWTGSTAGGDSFSIVAVGEEVGHWTVEGKG